MQRIAGGVLLLLLAVLVIGCAGMTPTEQRVLSGSALGAAAGAGIGAATGGSPAAGAAIGGAAGALGGVAVDQMERSRSRDTDRGYYDNDGRYYRYREDTYRGDGYRDRDRDSGYYRGDPGYYRHEFREEERYNRGYY